MYIPVSGDTGQPVSVIFITGIQYVARYSTQRIEVITFETCLTMTVAGVQHPEPLQQTESAVEIIIFETCPQTAAPSKKGREEQDFDSWNS